MSISFNTPVKGLSSIGFSVGDIAVLAGAGRTVGTWLKAHYIGQILLDMIDVEDLIPRTGLVDVSALDRRWSKRLVLFLNGRLLPVQEVEAKGILKKIKLDRFTWVMTLITSALLTVTSQSCLEHVLLEILTERCRESEGYEYLVKDFKRNIEAWTSIARTRTISYAAEERWLALEAQTLHLPGQIPDADYKDLCRFLLWLIGAGDGGKHSRVFHTASSDTTSLAAVLQHIGVDGIRIGGPQDDFEEGQLIVTHDTTRLTNDSPSLMPKRRGMRINLANMEETMLLWPGSATRNSQRRDNFLSAVDSTKGISVTVGNCETEGRGHDKGNLQPVFGFTCNTSGRLQKQMHTFAYTFFLAPHHQTLQAFTAMVSSWHLRETQIAKELQAILAEEPSSMDQAHLSDIQTFILGYYYGLLRSIVDVGQMSVAEAFGSWAWDDLELFKIIKGFCIVRILEIGTEDLSSTRRSQHMVPTLESSSSPSSTQQSSPDSIRFWERYMLLQLVAYLFAGAEQAQVAAIGRGCCGVKGKLTVVDATLLGDADSAFRVRSFVLLDIDNTIFPSTPRGILYCRRQNAAISNFYQAKDLEIVPYDEITLAKESADLTSLVEPRWDEDINQCMVSYGRHGQLVHNLDPEVIYHAVVEASHCTHMLELRAARVMFVTEGLPVSGKIFWSSGMGHGSIDIRNPCDIRNERSPPDRNPVAELISSQFDGGVIPLPPRIPGSLATDACIATEGLPKTRSCLVSIYKASEAHPRPRLPYSEPCSLLLYFEPSLIYIE